ncbi:MAG: polyprenyl synthetase family protein [Clostridiales bacterium]|nr:polyprenyl synthetase family protein [Clostridiales bacterium]
MENTLLSVKGLNVELSFVDNYIDEFLRTDQETGMVAQVLSNARGSRGKMIRPLLLLLAARFGPHYMSKRQRLCKLGALVEIVHMSSLVHDDIIDDSPLRRGRPTVQQQYGKDMAVFAGDFMISRVLHHLAEESLTREGMIIGRTIEEMCRGELGQMSCRWDTETTIDAYLRNIYGKSVALFVESVQLGARVSGAGEHTVNCLTAIGEHIGYMFQMRDDLLDFISEQRREGKPVHKDFTDGIYTLPVLYALGQPLSAARLREVAGINSDCPDYGALLQEMRELVRQSGGIAFCRRQIENHATQAGRQLKSLPAQEARLGLGDLIERLLDSGDPNQGRFAAQEV